MLILVFLVVTDGLDSEGQQAFKQYGLALHIPKIQALDMRDRVKPPT